MAQENSIQTSDAGAVPAESRSSTDSLLDRSLSDLIRFDWETVAWILLFVIAAITRFYDLGARGMSHDESLHTLYSYYLYDAGNYEHNPMMHGPFLFHANALIYTLFGDSDTTARIFPALAGMGIIWMARLFRRYIGRLGALMAGVLIVISPSLLFHSRYIRNDIYIALFTMIWIYSVFRYLDSRHKRWVTMMMLGMAFGFITKENHFITGAIVGAFFAGLAVWQVMGTLLFGVISPLILASGLGYWFHVRDQNGVAFVILGAALILSAGLFVAFMRGRKWSDYLHNVNLDLSVIMLTIVLPFTAPFGHQLLGWDPMAYSTRTDILRSALLVGGVTLLSVLIAFAWFGLRKRPSSSAENRSDSTDDPPVPHGALVDQPANELDPGEIIGFGDWGRLMGIFWAIQILFFTTFFTNTRNGLATGIVGSLGYWIKQQEVARGGQPWYYYLMLGGLYEFLPFLLSGIATLVIIYWLTKVNPWDPVPAQDLPDVVASEVRAFDQPAAGRRYLEVRSYFAAFGLWWILGSWAGYTVAGEKMPWLMTHMALPMCVVGGWYLGWMIRRVAWPQAVRSHAVWLIGLAPALIFALLLTATGVPELGRESDTLAGVTQWLVAVALLGGLIFLAFWLGRRVAPRDALHLLWIGVVALLFLLTVRFSFMLTYINYDYATEYLVYAHASPDVKRALSEIDMISERTVGERNIIVAYDDDSSWPMSWYMRQYPNARFYGSSPNSDVMSAPVVIVGPKNYEAVHPYVARDYVKRTYRLIWWPDQGYFGWTPQRTWETISDPTKLKNLIEIVFYRRYPSNDNPDLPRDLTQWPNRHEFEMWVRRDIAADIWDLGVAPLTGGAATGEALLRESEIDLSAETVYSEPYDGVALLTPRDVAVDQEGRRYIADTGNHRIVVLSPTGGFERAFGSYCNLAEGGCVDPDGAGPQEVGDGQFFEPWGVAVDNQGMIYVADTWNGRIQVFEAGGRMLRKWGVFNATDGEDGDPYLLFGPRGLAIDSLGNLLVADTGNKRILSFTPEGALVDQIGGGGVIAGRFEEPTDVAIDPHDGSIYVADAWNRRIQKLTSGLEPVAEWPVHTWDSQDRYHKPYLAVDAAGQIYASDPAMFRVLVYDATGEIKASFGRFGTELDRFAMPNGLAFDPITNQILVADADNQRVMVFPTVP